MKILEAIFVPHSLVSRRGSLFRTGVFIVFWLIFSLGMLGGCSNPKFKSAGAVSAEIEPLENGVKTGELLRLGMGKDLSLEKIALKMKAAGHSNFQIYITFNAYIGVNDAERKVALSEVANALCFGASYKSSVTSSGKHLGNYWDPGRYDLNHVEALVSCLGNQSHIAASDKQGTSVSEPNNVNLSSTSQGTSRDKLNETSLLTGPLHSESSVVESKEETPTNNVRLPEGPAFNSAVTTDLSQVEQSTQTKIASERRIALVIGNASYETAPLDNPINDATDIANELKRRGFKVITRNNANLGSLRQAVRNFSDEFKKSDVGLVYYSGHGVEAKGENYLIPVDADIRKEYELSAQAYPASQLTAMMEEVQSSDDKKRVAILILDACRDNPLTRSWRSSGRGLARMDAPAGTFISFSTAPGSVAADGRGRNSPFTKHLLQAMRKPDVPIELMFKEVRVGVMGETKGEQIPWDSSSLTGDFFFSRSEKR